VLAQEFIGRLDSARCVGKGRWVARCPSHNGVGRSLSIREADNGAILLHCWAHGCSAADITHALALTVTDLFPQRRRHHSPPLPGPERLQFVQVRDAARVLASESMVVLVAADHLAKGNHMSNEDGERLACAVIRIGDAAGQLGALTTADDVMRTIRQGIGR
jgi:hypothetical protein